jgi:signal transduction histidine kinase
MNACERILHVEDSPDDAELVRFALRGAPFGVEIVRVEDEKDYVAQLDARVPDLIICDYNLPRFSATRALEIVRERGLELPFILVSHHIGESAAVVAMQQGASDYLPKGDLARLPKAIETALDRSRERREKALAEEALRKSESIQRGILNSLISRIALLDAEGVVVAVNKAWEDFDAAESPAGMPKSVPGENYLNVLDRVGATLGEGFAAEFREGIRQVIAGEKRLVSVQYQVSNGAGTRWYMARAMPLEGKGQGAVVSHRDITDRMIGHVAMENAHRRLKTLSKRILAIQEEERRAISRELHDDVGQTLAALKIGLHRLAQGGAADPGTLMNECLAKADAALERLRQPALDLRPPQLDQLGLEDALGWLADRQRAVTGLEIRCKVTGLEQRRPPPAMESACYRIAQEALNNATRHANAKQVLLSVESDGRLLKLSIHDDGVGFDESDARERIVKSGNMGLIGMEERAQLAGGRLKLRSVPGGGTTVSAIFPLDHSDAEPDSAEALARST